MDVADADDETRPPALWCRAWLRGSGRALPSRLARGEVQVDSRALIWRSPRRWQPPVALDVRLLEAIGQRPLGPFEARRVDRDCTVLVLRYLTVTVELAVPLGDVALVRAAVERR